ncbi:hypothetical protein E2C01_043419 [Portunus trituberculatus]|uniref:Uncharacterized protein n=1 Tax=Portunus trituberculatus TaxID=210409 RepID=A0A5B7FQ91_PORTR|nr:hypothetical protein [Portunus trituberculatus]
MTPSSRCPMAISGGGTTASFTHPHPSKKPDAHRSHASSRAEPLQPTLPCCSAHIKDRRDAQDTACYEC